MTKFFDPGEMLIPTMQELGEKVGEFIPRLSSKVSESLKRRGIPIDDLPDPVKAALPELLKLAAGGATIPRTAIPVPGELGRLIHLYINEMLDGIGVGAARAVGAGGDPKPAGDGKGADDGSRKGYVVDSVWYPDACTHRSPPFAPKGGSPPPRISLVEALRRGHEVHKRGCVTDAEIAKATAALAAETTAASPSAPAEAKATSPKADHAFGDLIARLSEERGPLADVYVDFMAAYTSMTRTDATLDPKFRRAFHRRGAYEQFLFVVRQPPEEWHMHLDHLLDDVPSPGGDGFLKETVERERQETVGAFQAAVGHLKQAGDATAAYAESRAAELKKKRDRIKKLKAKAEERSGTTSKVKSALLIIAALALIFWLKSNNII